MNVSQIYFEKTSIIIIIIIIIIIYLIFLEICLKALRRTLFLHFTIMFYHDSLCCISLDVYERFDKFALTAYFMYYFFVKQKQFFKLSLKCIYLISLWITRILRLEDIFAILTLLLNIVRLIVWVGLYYFALIILCSFEFHYVT